MSVYFKMVIYPLKVNKEGWIFITNLVAVFSRRFCRGTEAPSSLVVIPGGREFLYAVSNRTLAGEKLVKLVPFCTSLSNHHLKSLTWE